MINVLSLPQRHATKASHSTHTSTGMDASNPHRLLDTGERKQCPHWPIFHFLHCPAARSHPSDPFWYLRCRHGSMGCVIFEPEHRLIDQVRQYGLRRFSSPILVSGPCPVMTRVSSGSGTSLCRTLSSSCSPSDVPAPMAIHSHAAEPRVYPQHDSTPSKSGNHEPTLRSTTWADTFRRTTQLSTRWIHTFQKKNGNAEPRLYPQHDSTPSKGGNHELTPRSTTWTHPFQGGMPPHNYPQRGSTPSKDGIPNHDVRPTAPRNSVSPDMSNDASST
jgi:hypothetical protein